MKTLTLNDFHNKVKKLALRNKRTYFTATIEIGEHIYKDGSNKPFIRFKCYVDGYYHYEGETINEALGKLRNAMFPSTKPVPVVEVEI